jgi:hypothetical protein
VDTIFDMATPLGSLPNSLYSQAIHAYSFLSSRVSAILRSQGVRELIFDPLRRGVYPIKISQRPL